MDAVTTFQTSSGTAHSNPIVLDSAGRISGSSELYLTPGQSYKFILLDSAGVQIWVQDNITATPLSSSSADVTGTAGEGISAGQVAYMARGTEPGTAAGNWYRAHADTALTSSDALIVGVAPETIAVSAQGVFRLLGDVTVTGPLTPGAAYFVGVSFGTMTSTEPSHSRYIGQAKSTTILTVAANPTGSGGLNILQVEALLG